MFRTAIISLFIGSLSTAAPVPKWKAKGTYYPMNNGDRRVLVSEVNGRKIEFSEMVIKVESIDGNDVVTVERKAANVVETVAYEVSGDGLLYRGPTMSGAASFPAVLLLKSGCNAGDSWTAEGVEGAVMRFTIGEEEEIEVPAGKYKAMRVNSELEEGGVVYKFSRWYAPGTGLIQTEVYCKGKKVTVVLKSFTPGTSEPKKDVPKNDK